MIYQFSKWFLYSLPMRDFLMSVEVRWVGACITSLVVSWMAGAWFIRYSQYFKTAARLFTPQSHQSKNNTPTMGGLFILVAVCIGSFLWCDLSRAEVWLFLGSLLGFGVIGLWDDMYKILWKKGIKESHKFRAQLFVGTITASIWYFFLAPPAVVAIPFLKGWMPYLGIFLIP